MFLKMFPCKHGLHFDDPAKTFFLKVWICFDESEKNMFFLKMFRWTPRLHFWKACPKNYVKTWKFFCRKSPKSLKRQNFPKKHLSKSSSVDGKDSFDMPAKFFSQTFEKISLKLWKLKKYLEIPQKIFLWTCRRSQIQLKTFRRKVGWSFHSECESDEAKRRLIKKTPRNIRLEMLNAVLTSLLENFAESCNAFCSKSGNGKGSQDPFPQRNFSKRSPGHVEINFFKPAEILLPKIRNVFAQSP